MAAWVSLAPSSTAASLPSAFFKRFAARARKQSSWPRCGRLVGRSMAASSCPSATKASSSSRPPPNIPCCAVPLAQSSTQINERLCRKGCGGAKHTCNACVAASLQCSVLRCPAQPIDMLMITTCLSCVAGCNGTNMVVQGGATCIQACMTLRTPVPGDENRSCCDAPVTKHTCSWWACLQRCAERWRAHPQQPSWPRRQRARSHARARTNQARRGGPARMLCNPVTDTPPRFGQNQLPIATL